MPTLGDDALTEELSTLSAQLDAATHRQLTLMRQVHERQLWYAQGARSCVHWLSWRIGLSPGTARDRLHVAHALAGLPLIDAALAAGQLSDSKVRAMARVATPDNEERLLHMALHSTASQLERICRGIRQAAKDDQTTPARYVSSRSMHDGTIKVEARLHADEASLLLETLAQVQMSMNQPQDGAAPKASRADALVRMLQRFTSLADAELSRPRTGADQAQVVLHIDPSALEEDALDATLEDATHVSAETLRRVSCDCGLLPITTQTSVAESAVAPSTGVALDVGRKTRRVHPALRRAGLARDGRRCRFPGCDCTRYLDAHHIERWLHGGETTRENLISLCPRHHQLVHEGVVALQGSGSRPVFRDPRGELLEPIPPMPERVSAETTQRRLRALGEERAIGPETGLCAWMGETPDYERCVAAALLETPGGGQ